MTGQKGNLSTKSSGQIDESDVFYCKRFHPRKMNPLTKTIVLFLTAISLLCCTEYLENTIEKEIEVNNAHSYIYLKTDPLINYWRSEQDYAKFYDSQLGGEIESY